MPYREWVLSLSCFVLFPAGNLGHRDTHKTVNSDDRICLDAYETRDPHSEDRPNFDQGRFWKEKELGLSVHPGHRLLA